MVAIQELTAMLKYFTIMTPPDLVAKCMPDQVLDAIMPGLADATMQVVQQDKMVAILRDNLPPPRPSIFSAISPILELAPRDRTQLCTFKQR